jgi:hypothetical protein
MHNVVLLNDNEAKTLDGMHISNAEFGTSQLLQLRLSGRENGCGRSV